MVDGSDNDAEAARTNKAVAATGAGDKVVLSTLTPELFSVSANYFVKMAVLKGVRVYRTSRYAVQHPCEVDSDCRTHFFKTLGALKELKHDPPDDFNCDLDQGHCYGLDWRTNMYAVCRLLLAPLFGVSPSGSVADRVERAIGDLSYPFRNGAANAIRRCMAPDPADRPTPRQLQDMLEALPSDALPPFFIPNNCKAEKRKRKQSPTAFSLFLSRALSLSLSLQCSTRPPT